MAKRVRAKGQNPKDDIQQTRYNLYKSAIDKAAESKDKGFFLEGITLFESLITDRLESTLTKVTGAEVSFKTLGTLIRMVDSCAAFSPDFCRLITTDLDAWRKERNRALHEIVKLEDGNLELWETRYQALEATYDQGFHLFRQIDLAIRKMDI